MCSETSAKLTLKPNFRNNKTIKPLLALALIFVLTLSSTIAAALLAPLILPTQQVNVKDILTNEETRAAPTANNELSFKPAMWKPTWADQDNNGVADTLDQEIVTRLVNNTAEDFANLIVALKTQPTTQDADAFVLSGGYLTTSPWTHAIYGFGGQMPYNHIAEFVQSDPNVLLIEKEQISHAQIAYAAQQIGARAYVWNTLGLQGDPQSSIAVVDTGIDDSHPDFTPGYGDQNFTKKIVGWNNQITPSATSPYDDNGHGSHVSGLATGNGFFSTDLAGNAVATWGANLGAVGSSGTYFISGMMVNKTGTITINVKWRTTGTAKLSALLLYNGDKSLSTGSWIQVASVNTPNQENWYSLNYQVTSTPSDGYDMYHILMSLTKGTGDLYAVFSVSWPYTSPSDGFLAWTGIAPQTRLVGVKVLDSSGSGTDTGLINGIDWIIANRQIYHIVIASMSLGFTSEVPTVDAALVNLVDSGVTTIVAAGNSGSGSNKIYTPGSVDEVVTVAATNQFDNIASFSSQGGTSRYTGKTTKPDIAAPGGSFYAVPLLSTDSNDFDADGMWADVAINDSAPMQGTSMSAPIVSGAASLLIQAMGGFANWQWTRSQALQPKMLLMMTATETYPNLRESGTSATSPTLQRGGKDAHEGYGRINLDAAIDALTRTYNIGTTTTDTLGRPPTPTDISVLGQKLGWARKVQLNTEGRYNFTLSVPTGADFDMYLYNSTGTSYGEPAIVAKSINTSTGGHEQIILTAPYNGTYHLVVKRATATTQGGTFTLASTFTPKHDIAVLTVEPSATSVYEGNSLNITVTVKNNGLNTESFDVSALYNNTIIGTQGVSNLASRATTVLTFTWNSSGATHGNYTVKAQAGPVQNEFSSADNTLIDGTVQVKIPGDINGDQTVDILDVSLLSAHWYPGPPIGPLGYDANADINNDGAISVLDMSIISAHWTGPPAGPLSQA